MRTDHLGHTDSARPLLRALRVHAAAAGCPVEFRDWQSRPWSSALFTGHRHDVQLVVGPDPAGEAWLASLAEADLPMHGCYLADLLVRRDADAITVEALVLLD